MTYIPSPRNPFLEAAELQRWGKAAEADRVVEEQQSVEAAAMCTDPQLVVATAAREAVRAAKEQELQEQQLQQQQQQQQQQDEPVSPRSVDASGVPINSPHYPQQQQQQQRGAATEKPPQSPRRSRPRASTPQHTASRRTVVATLPAVRRSSDSNDSVAVGVSVASTARRSSMLPSGGGTSVGGASLLSSPRATARHTTVLSSMASADQTAGPSFFSAPVAAADNLAWGLSEPQRSDDYEPFGLTELPTRPHTALQPLQRPVTATHRRWVRAQQQRRAGSEGGGRDIVLRGMRQPLQRPQAAVGGFGLMIQGRRSARPRG